MTARLRPLRDWLAGGVIGAAVLAWFGHAFLNYDTFYALVWGSQFAHGITPDYRVPVAPTPHPLAEALGIPLSLFGDSAEALALALVLLGFGFLLVAIYKLGKGLYGWPVGLLGAAIAGTRVPLLNFGIRGYVDLPAIAFILWGAVLEMRRPRRGESVLVLLALAGLLRPEAWLFSFAYLLWAAPPRDTRGRVRLVAIALAGPVLWMVSDALVTGDALWSLHGTHELAAQLGRKTGLGNVPPIMPRRLGEIVRLPELVAAVAGFVLGLWFMRRRTLLPAAIAVLNGITFLVLAIAGLSLLGRYLFLAGAVLSLFAALGALGWLALPAHHPWRPRWRALGALLLLAFAIFFPLEQVGRLTSLRTDIAHRQRVLADLQTLIQSPPSKAALRSCGTLFVPNHQPVPQLAYWTGRRPGAIALAGLTPPTPRGAYVGPTTLTVAKRSVLDPRDPGKPPYAAAHGPPGYRQLARNRSWILWTGHC